jgi:glycosyltransferase involved in cell wall biosynthesis
VVYNVAGLRDAVVQGETGFLVEPGNISELGEQICRVLEDDALRLALSKNALEHSKTFSWDSVANEFMRVAKTVIGDRLKS